MNETETFSKPAFSVQRMQRVQQFHKT